MDLRDWPRFLAEAINAAVGAVGAGGGELQLQWPLVLLLLPLPLAMLLLPSANAWGAALRLPTLTALEELAGAAATARRWPRQLPLWLLWSLLLLAAARPFWNGAPVQLPTQGRDMLLVVDISGSMKIKDMRAGERWISRVKAVKNVVGEFVERRRGDRMGLVLFGALPYLQAPLSFDLGAVHNLLLEAQPGFAGEKTAIGDALGLAIKRLRDRPAPSKVVILLTDGQSNSGRFEPLTAAGWAKEAGVRVHTVGVGADRIPQRSIFGARMVQNRDLDERTLRAIARRTGGRYFRARNPSQLEKIYRELGRLEPVQQESELFRPRTELFHWSLGLALTLSQLLALGYGVSALARARRLRGV